MFFIMFLCMCETWLRVTSLCLLLGTAGSISDRFCSTSPPQKPTYRQSGPYRPWLGRNGGLFRAPKIKFGTPASRLARPIVVRACCFPGMEGREWSRLCRSAAHYSLCITTQVLHIWCCGELMLLHGRQRFACTTLAVVAEVDFLSLSRRGCEPHRAGQEWDLNQTPISFLGIMKCMSFDTLEWKSIILAAVGLLTETAAASFSLASLCDSCRCTTVVVVSRMPEKYVHRDTCACLL